MQNKWNEVRYVTESDMVVALDKHGEFAVPPAGAKVDFNEMQYLVVDVQYRRGVNSEYEVNAAQTTVILDKIGKSSKDAFKPPVIKSNVFDK